MFCMFFFSSRRRHTRYWRDWSSDVCSSDLSHQWCSACVFSKRSWRSAVSRRSSARVLTSMDRARFLLPLAAGEPRGDLLEQPAVPVRVLERVEREVGAPLRVTTADARVLTRLVEGSASVVED